MKKSKTLTLFIGLLTAVVCYAQTSLAATWFEKFSTTKIDRGYVVITLSDGNYIIGGTVVNNKAVNDDIYLAKLDLDGDVIWQKAYKSAGEESIVDLKETSDGGFIVGGDVLDNYYVMKTDSAGTIQWQKLIDNTSGGGGADDMLSFVEETIDGGYLIGGVTNAITNNEAWIVKLDSSGNYIWDVSFGGTQYDRINDVYENADGTLLVVGNTDSFQLPAILEVGGWVTKIDSAGNILWSNIYHETIPGPSNVSIQLTDIERAFNLSNYVIVGSTSNSTGPTTFNEAALVEIDGTGAIVSEYAYGDGTAQGDLFSAIKSGGDYYMSGWTNSFGTGEYDAMFMIVDGFVPGTVDLAKTYGYEFTTRKNESFESIDAGSDGGFIFTGWGGGSGAGKQSDILVIKTDGSGGLDNADCTKINDVTSSIVVTPLTSTIVDETASLAVASGAYSIANGTLTEYDRGLYPERFCAACFIVYGTDPMDAGTTNELDIEAVDIIGNTAELYDGVKNLVFSGLGSVGGNNPEVEGVDFGSTLALNFTDGISTVNGATLIAYLAETSTVHVTDGNVTSQAIGACPDNGLPLTVNGLALNHYEVTATSPQTVGTGWTEIVRAVDMYGNVRTADNHAFNVTNSGNAAFFTNGTFSLPTATYTLVSGVANIFLKDNNVETITITADDGTFTGTSGAIVVNPKAPVAGGRPSGGGGSAPLPATTTTLRESAEEGEVYETLSCLKKQTPEYLFGDTAGHFGESAIKLLAETLSYSTYVTVGYGNDGELREFRPDQPITRAEFLKMAMTSNCMQAGSFGDGSGVEKIFSDIPLESTEWYKDFVYSAAEAGIVSGYTDGTFGPDKAITRAEATKILVNVQHLMADGYEGTKYFDDVNESEWYFDYVSSGKENELIYGAEENGKSVFKPNEKISRAETALILVRIFNLRNYVSFTDSNASDYEYVLRTDGQASLLSAGTEGLIIPLLIGLGAGGVGLTVYLKGQKKGKK